MSAATDSCAATDTPAHCPAAQYFSFEVQVLDDKNVRRRFRASNYQARAPLEWKKILKAFGVCVGSAEHPIIRQMLRSGCSHVPDNMGEARQQEGGYNCFFSHSGFNCQH